MALTNKQRLDQIESAITAIETKGQSYTIGGRSLNRGNLAELYAERRRLERLVARDTRGGLRTRYGTPTT